MVQMVTLTPYCRLPAVMRVIHSDRISRFCSRGKQPGGPGDGSSTGGCSWCRPCQALHPSQLASRPRGSTGLAFALRSRNAYCSDFSTRSRATRMQFLARPRKPLACGAVEGDVSGGEAVPLAAGSRRRQRRQGALDPKAAGRRRAPDATHAHVCHHIARAGPGSRRLPRKTCVPPGGAAAALTSLNILSLCMAAAAAAAMGC